MCAACFDRVGQLASHAADRVLPLGERSNAVDETPLDGTLALDALRDGAEHVIEVAAHLALVGDARQPAGSGEHAEQRHLGKRHGAVAVVDQQNLVAGQGELVAAAGGRAVERGQEAHLRVLAGVLDTQARLVRELAEVHFEGVAAGAQHQDVVVGL